MPLKRGERELFIYHRYICVCMCVLGVAAQKKRGRTVDACKGKRGIVKYVMWDSGSGIKGRAGKG